MNGCARSDIVTVASACSPIGDQAHLLERTPPSTRRATTRRSRTGPAKRRIR